MLLYSFLFQFTAAADSWITTCTNLFHNTDIFCSYLFITYPSCSLFLLCFLSLLPFPHCHFSIYASCFCPLFPSIFLLVTWATLAVEIKVIKDLPWPPPVGQLNTSPPPVEELESPSHTAQPSPGQTSCDQHHHGGCWCSHCPPSSPLVSPLSVFASIHLVHLPIIPSIYLSNKFLQCGRLFLCLSMQLISLMNSLNNKGCVRALSKSLP